MAPLLLIAAAAAAEAPDFDAFAHREAQPAAFAAELERLRQEERERFGLGDGERLARMLIARDASSAADYRRRLAELAGFRAALKADTEAALAGRYTTEWLNSRWLNEAMRTRDPDARELFRRIFADQHQLFREQPPRIAEAANAIVGLEMRRLGRENTAWLKGVLARIGWFNIGRYGPNASTAAWLIVQHADHDPAWQAAVLESLRDRAARGDVQRSWLAFLEDRVAVNAGRPQAYGTQGYCVDGGRWQPRTIEDPDGLDRRRAEAGLPPMADYGAAQGCA